LKKDRQSPGRRERKLVQLGIGVLLLALVISAAWYLTSQRFENWVRGNVIAEMENITGGRVEIGSFHWSLWRLEIDLHDLTVHGLEPAGEAPYAHVDHLLVRLKILSLFSGNFGLRTLIAERPVIHITVGAGGVSNQPMPIIAKKNQHTAAQSLFDLGIERAEISNGELIWNDRYIPLNLLADDVAAKLTYISATRRYDGSIKIGKLDTSVKDLRPFSSSMQAEFSLFPNMADLSSLRWQSGDSVFTLKSHIADLRSLKFEGDYDLLLDLREVGTVMRRPELHGGILQMTGKGSLSVDDFSSQGKMVLKKAEWRSQALHTPALNLSAGYSVDKTRWTLAQIMGNGFGGAFSGEAEWHDWMSGQISSAPAAAPVKAKASIQVGRVHLHLRALQASEVAKAISTPALPLDRLRPAGEISGDVDLNWKGSLNALQSTAAATVTPPATPPAYALPLLGEFRGSYQRAGDRLDITDAHLSTVFTTITASGTLSAQNSMLNLTVKSSNSYELQPLLSALNISPALSISNAPVELHGPASFLGVVTGRLNSPAVNGHLELTDFYSLFPAITFKPAGGLQTAAQNSPPPQRIHWDKLSADVHLDSNNLAVHGGSLTRGQTQIDLQLSAALRRYKFIDDSQFSAAIAVHDALLEDLQSFAGVSYPVTGTVNLNFQLSGTRVDPHGDGSFELVQGTAWSRPFKSLRSQVRLTQQEVQLNNFVLSLNGARMTGAGSYNLATEGIRFDVAGENFDLAHIPALNSEKIFVQGTAAFQASGSGTLNAPILNAKVMLRNLVLNGERQGDLTIEANTQGADLRLKAYSQLQDATLQLDGNVLMRGSWPADITLNLRRIDFDPLLHAYLQGHITGHSSAEGSLHLQGPLRDLRHVNFTGEFSQLSADIENVKLRNEGPVRFSADQGVLKLEQVHIVGEGTDFSAQGSLPFSLQEPVNLNFNGQMNLKVLQGYYPGLQSYGDMSVAVKAAGTFNQPAVSGQVQISNAGVSLIDLPNGLSGMNGTLVFNQNRLQVQSLTARSGGGDLKLSGFIAYSRGVYFDLAATGNDVRLRYPQGVSAEASADLRFAGSPQSSTLSGEITVNRFSLTPSFDFGSYVIKSKQESFTSSADSPLSNVHLAVHVITHPELQVQSSLAKVSGDADLNLRGTVARPVVLGRVNISSGDIYFNGTTYHLERGDVLFINPLAIIPILDMEATTRVRDYDIMLGFHGPIDRLTTTYRSDPPLPPADIIALLALGRTREEQVLNNTQTSTTITDTAANAILGQALNYALSSRVQRLFGASRIKIDPQVGEPGTPGARLTVEQSVSNKVTLTYITNLSQSAQQVIQIEIQINKNLSLVALRDQYGVVGFDFRIRQRRR
jgi:translocation and assembly module TamB